MGDSLKSIESSRISKFILIQHILSSQVSDTGPMVLWFLLYLVRSFSNLQVMRTGIESYTSLNFGQIIPLPTELGVLECLKNSHRCIIGKWCLQASSFSFYCIFIKLAGNQDRHEILDEFKFRQDQISHFGAIKKFLIYLHFQT